MESKKMIIIKEKKVNIPDIIIFMISFSILILSLLAFYPGIMSSDSMVQWDQIQKNEYMPWHPIFHTLFEKMITIVWNNPAAIAIVQSLVFSLFITFLFKLSRGKEKKIGIMIIQFLMTILIFFIPVNFIYPVTLWKDVIYSFSLFAIFVYLYKGIKREFNYTLKDQIILAICCTCTSFFRYNGIITVFVILAVMFALAILKKRTREFGKFFLIFIICFVILKIPTLLVKQVKGETRYKSGIFIHLTGCLLKNDKITDNKDLEFLNSIYDIEKWSEKYTPFTHDTLMFDEEMRGKDEYISQNSDKLRNIVIKYSLKHPITIIKHYYYLTAITWKVKPFEENYYSFVVMTNSDQNLNYTNVNQRPILNIVNKELNKYNDFILSNKTLNIILYRPAFLLYCSLIGVTILIFVKKKKIYLLLMLPLIANIISVIPAMPAQDFRYFYINMLSLIGIVAILVTDIAKISYKYYEQKNNK